MRALAPLAPFLSLASVLLLASRPAVRAEDDPEPFACPIKAILATEDAGLRRVYDGVRKGLEQASLPRVCLTLLEEDPDHAIADLSAHPPPLLFVLGREAAEALGDALATTPRVFVDTAWNLGEDQVPPPPRVVAPCAVVRGAISAARLHGVLQELGRANGGWRFVPEARTPREEEDLLRLATDGTTRGPPFGEILIHHHLFTRPDAPSLGDLVRTAREEHVPLLSDDLALWGRGAAVVMAPDHFLLGRIAADLGRRLLEAPEPTRLERVVGITEVRVDLEEAARQGLHLPVPFLAGADVLRGTRAALDRPEGDR